MAKDTITIHPMFPFKLIAPEPKEETKAYLKPFVIVLETRKLAQHLPTPHKKKDIVVLRL